MWVFGIGGEARCRAGESPVPMPSSSRVLRFSPGGQHHARHGIFHRFGQARPAVDQGAQAGVFLRQKRQRGKNMEESCESPNNP